MPENPYDDRKVSLRRPHGNGDLDIVRASYTRRTANVTEALSPNSIILVFSRVKSGNFGYHVNSEIHLQTVEIQMRRFLVDFHFLLS